MFRILLAVDGSQASEKAVMEAAERQWPSDTVVEALSVVEPAHLWATSSTARDAAAAAHEIARCTAQKLRFAGLEATGCAVSGDPKAVILEHASKPPADFVIVGSHGASKVTRFLLGNVAASVVRHAPGSVIVARHGGPVRKLLLATDGSAHSEAAARSIAARGWPPGTEVRVLSVVEFVLPAYQALLEPPFIHSDEADSIRVQALKHAQDAVAKSVEILRTTGLEIAESVSVLMENPRDVILKEAAEWGADAIVVGSHGRRGTDRFLLGSVSEAIAARAECSVEVIRLAG